MGAVIKIIGSLFILFLFAIASVWIVVAAEKVGHGWGLVAGVLIACGWIKMIWEQP